MSLDCGLSLFYEDEGPPGLVDIHLGAFNDPETFEKEPPRLGIAAAPPIRHSRCPSPPRNEQPTMMPFRGAETWR